MPGTPRSGLSAGSGSVAVTSRAAPAIVRRDHSLAAREVVGSVTFLAPTLDLVDGHHERVDGQGHPLGLVGGEIPLGALVLAVAEHLVALARRREELLLAG